MAGIAQQPDERQRDESRSGQQDEVVRIGDTGGLASDFAAMIRAALALFEATGTRSYLERAVAWGERTLGALHAPLDGVADHVATTRAYAAAAARAGAVIRTGARVTSIDAEAGRVAAVVVAGGELEVVVVE